MIKEYKQVITIDGDELDAVWAHEPQTMDEPEHWTLVSVDGFPENMCPEEIWVQAEAAFDWTVMDEIDDRDFESIIEDEERLKNGW